MNDIPQFGEKEVGIEYRLRPGVYAVVSQPDCTIGVVEVNGKYFLIGGGIDEGENEEDALRREILEEVGRTTLSISPIGRANQYINRSIDPINKVGSYFKAELGDKVGTPDPTHPFQWVTIDEFRTKAANLSDIHIVETLFDLKSAT